MQRTFNAIAMCMTAFGHASLNWRMNERKEERSEEKYSFSGHKMKPLSKYFTHWLGECDSSFAHYSNVNAHNGFCDGESWVITSASLIATPFLCIALVLNMKGKFTNSQSSSDVHESFECIWNMYMHFIVPSPSPSGKLILVLITLAYYFQWWIFLSFTR